MADPLWGQQMTNMWMLDPTMFDPTQKSNQFSNFNNKAFPFPATYNDAASSGGGPTDAMGNQIQSYQDWKTANPAGTTINNTQAQPQTQGKSLQDMISSFTPLQQQWWAGAPANEKQMAMQMYGVTGSGSGGGGTAQQAATGGSGGGYSPYPNAAGGGDTSAFSQYLRQQNDILSTPAVDNSGQRGATNNGPISDQNIAQMRANNQTLNQLQQQASAPQQQAQQQQTNAAPNNWQAALNALANPGKVTTPGATVPMVQGYQPAGGVNNAWLQQAQGRPGMNQNFLSALAAIQGRQQG